MPRALPTVVLSLALAGAGPMAYGLSCSCMAPDHSCSASISCSGACYASCGTHGACSSGCGSSDDIGTDHQSYPSTVGEISPFSWLASEGMNPAELSQRVSEHFGVAFAYVPDDPKESVAVDLKGLSLNDLRGLFARRGAVATASRIPSGSGAVAASRISLRAQNARVETIVEALMQVSESPIDLGTLDPDARFALDIKAVTQGDLTMILKGMKIGRPADQ